MTSRIEFELALDELGNVPESYEHEWRFATPMAPLVVPGGVFKWYHAHREGVAVPGDLDADARAAITDAVERDGWDLSYGLNFALLHLSTAHAFLIAGVWRGHQELWERIYVMDLEQPGPFVRLESGKHDDPLACVWELGVICHERMAWHRYLFSARTEADKHAWLSDSYTGEV